MPAKTELSRVPIIDTDTHVVEPVDLWTSRIPAKFADRVPQVSVSRSGKPRWRIGDKWLTTPGWYGQAGWPEYPPSAPVTLDEIDPGSYDPTARLGRMDEYGIAAQVLYPNLIGFETQAFLDVGTDLALLCTKAYNDFLTEFCSRDPDRLIPIAMVPFWDLEEAEKEIRRCAEAGHAGILFANQYERIHLPYFYDPYWDRIYATAQECGLSINFHIGFASGGGLLAPTRPGMVGSGADENADVVDVKWTAQRNAVQMMTSNGTTIASLLTTGLLDRFPDLKFVSVESGMGYLPYLLESLDWHWKGHGATRYSEFLPSEYFRRQCYGTFWFETGTLFHLESYPDNFMFETDYPHPTSMSPGPVSPALVPSEHVNKHFAQLPLNVAEKALWINAAKVYNLDVERILNGDEQRRASFSRALDGRQILTTGT